MRMTPEGALIVITPLIGMGFTVVKVMVYIACDCAILLLCARLRYWIYE